MRGKRAKVRKQNLDKKYNSAIIARIINKVMQDGKKSLAEDLVYSAIEGGAGKMKVDVLDFINQSVDNVRPALELKARRVGGSNYQVPVPVSTARQEALSVRWLVDISRSKKGKTFDDILMNELINAYNGEGEAVKKKSDVEKMAEANKAFAHFRW